MNVANLRTVTPLIAATKEGSNLNILIDCGAVTRDHLDSTNILIVAGADVNATNEEGQTALLVAAVDVNFPNKYGDTPLSHAGREGKLPYVNILLNTGADVNHYSKNGTTAFIAACENGHYNCKNSSIKAACVNEGDKENITLMYYAMNGFDKYVDVLLEGADVNLFDSDWNTPLIMTAEEGHLHTILILLQANAKINRYNKMALNALEMYISSTNNLNNNVLLLLYAAGEKLTNEGDYILPDVVQHQEEQMPLMHICRQAIRKHLINLFPHFALFRIVPP